jgi:DNA excision repair protein ERCC-4
LHSYDAAGRNLIIVVGAEDQENDWMGQFLAEQAALSAAPNARGLNLVNTHMSSVASRQKLYASGGILSITSQILVVDLLSGVLEPSTITGLVVLHAERVTAVSVEAFILRIYRQHNKDGFLKAFSDSPGSFTSGFAPLSNMLRNLFLRKPLLYPRFQIDVAKSLEGHRKAEVIELEIELSESMTTIQAAIMDCVEASIGELKKGSTGLDVTDWNLDNALHLDFDTIVMNQLRPVWHRLHPKVKQIAGDLRTLRTMLSYLVTRDAIEFCKYLDLTVAASQSKSARMNQSPWLFLDAAHTIIETARHRVYAGKLNDAPGHQMDDIRPVLEELPKWSVLGGILEEIEQHVYTNPVRDDSSGAILIMCEDNATCAQLRDYIKSMDRENTTSEESDVQPTASAMMTRKLKHYVQWKKNISRFSAMVNSESHKPPESSATNRESLGRGPPSKRRRVRGASAVASNPSREGRAAGDKDAHIASLLEESRFRDGAEGISDPSNEFGDHYELYEMSDLIVLHPYDGDIDDHVLEEVRPRYVIMYEPDTAFIRRVELYRSSHTNRDVRVYFMYYRNSTEEQKYLSAVRKEKDSFTKLIRERGVSHNRPSSVAKQFRACRSSSIQRNSIPRKHFFEPSIPESRAVDGWPRRLLNLEWWLTFESFDLLCLRWCTREGWTLFPVY